MPIANLARGILIGTWIGGLLWLENRRALRAVHKNKLRRDVRNLVIAVPAGGVMQLLEIPVAFKLAQIAQNHEWGILPNLRLPAIVSGILGVVLLDYTLYWWHYLTHRVPVLWRFHQVHHLDQEMDATTALRFHFGEIAISIAFRAAQVIVIGPAAPVLASWQVFLFLCILFHHSNVRLPLTFERRLARILITPRLHGIHHSIAPQEVNSNGSSGLSVWDLLHRTLRTETPQDALTLGVRGFLGESDDTVGRALGLPFQSAAEPPEYDGTPVRQSFDAIG